MTTPRPPAYSLGLQKALKLTECDAGVLRRLAAQIARTGVFNEAGDDGVALSQARFAVVEMLHHLADANDVLETPVDRRSK